MRCKLVFMHLGTGLVDKYGPSMGMPHHFVHQLGVTLTTSIFQMDFTTIKAIIMVNVDGLHHAS